MKITKTQLRRIVREQLLREQVEDRISFPVLFQWDDYNRTGRPGKSQATVFVTAEELFEYEAEDPVELASSWAPMNLDGGLDISGAVIDPAENDRVQAWIDRVWANG